MIILDSCILRGLSLEDSEADLLRTIRTSRVERVAAPWMVLEELAAQKAVAYRKKHDAARQAVTALADATPWDYEASLGPCDMDRLRKHWRDRYLTVVEELPTSERALREAVFREANALPPCKETEGGRSTKTGARDAAIWLSAVEYARTHPNETVYFVSSNTRDFGDGTAYKPPMDTDVADLGDRFVLLTSMSQVIARFTEPAATDEDLVAKTLRSANVLKSVKKTAKKRLGPDEGRFECIARSDGISRELEIGVGLSWLTLKAQFHSVQDVRTYRIGEHEWCTAVVRWDLGGTAFVDTSTSRISAITSAGCAWTTSVIFKPDPVDPRLTILRHDRTQALSPEEFEALEISATPAVTALMLREYLNGLQAKAAIGPLISGVAPEDLYAAYRHKAAEEARKSALERRLLTLLKDVGEPDEL